MWLPPVMVWRHHESRSILSALGSLALRIYSSGTTLLTGIVKAVRVLTPKSGPRGRQAEPSCPVRSAPGWPVWKVSGQARLWCWAHAPPWPWTVLLGLSLPSHTENYIFMVQWLKGRHHPMPRSRFWGNPRALRGNSQHPCVQSLWRLGNSAQKVHLASGCRGYRCWVALQGP